MSPLHHFLVSPLLGFLLGVASFAHAAVEPKELLVFPDTLPEVLDMSVEKMAPVMREDKIPDSRQVGVKLVSPKESIFHCPEAAVFYEVPNFGRLMIQVVDDPKVMTIATRLGQERMLLGGSLGVPGAVTRKISIHPKSAPDQVIDGYLTHGPKLSPTLILIVPGSSGKDRFTVTFGFIGRGSDSLGQAEKVIDWLPVAAAQIDAAHLKSLP